MARRVTLIAGSGALAPHIAEAVRRRGDALQVIDIVGRGDLSGATTLQIPLSRAGELIAGVKAFHTTHLILAGGVHISDADREGLAQAFGFAGRVARVLGDVGVATMVLLFCRMQRIRLVGAHEVAPELLASEGLMAGPAVAADVLPAALKALQAARAIGSIDLGQSVVFSGNRPVAAEDTGGTDALLQRAAALRAAGLAGNSGMPLILGKARKPKQPSFVDLPAIGPQTVINAAAAGISIIVVEARGTLLLDRESLFSEAEARGVSVIGLRHG